MNVVREEKLDELINFCRPEIHLMNNEKIDLQKPVESLEYYDVLATKLVTLQESCAAYLDIITKFDGPTTEASK